MRSLGLSILLAQLWTGCDPRTSHRSDFQRQVTPPDAAADAPLADAALQDGSADAMPASPVVAFRATRFEVALPDGLAAFQDVLTSPAVMRGGLNFLVASTQVELEGPSPVLRIGSADPLPPDQYVFSTRFRPATVPASLMGGTLHTSAAFHFTLLVRLPYDVVVPIVAASLTGMLSADGTQLEGTLEGTVLAEDAATSLIDTQNDQNPANDTPLLNFLGTPDTDADGDGVRDDFHLVVRISSARVALVPQ